MTGLEFNILDGRPETHAAVPSLAFRLRIQSPMPVHAVLLHCRVQIEPRRRSHSPAEQERLAGMFGEPSRWPDTLQPLVWTRTTLSVPSFDESAELDVPVPCTYDFDVVSAAYLQSIEAGEIPLLFLFSGTVFAKTVHGFAVEQIAWDKEASYRMPVQVWRALMESYFPGTTWIRLRHETLDTLQRFRARRGLLSWDETIDALAARKAAAS